MHRPSQFRAMLVSPKHVQVEEESPQTPKLGLRQFVSTFSQGPWLDDVEA